MAINETPTPVLDDERNTKLVDDLVNELVELTDTQVEELEYLCQPSYNINQQEADAHNKLIATFAQKCKKKILGKLAKIFEDGNEHAARDQWKAYECKIGAGIEADPPGYSSILRTDTLYKFHAWFITGVRLFLVRLGRILAKLGHAILPSFFAFFGLSYGIELGIDLAIVLKVTFNPVLSAEEIKANHPSWKRYWIRFKTIIRKDNRPYRMLNDLVWVLVNGIVLCTAGPLYLLLNPILNLIGFVFDTGHEFFWLGRDAQKYTRLLNKIQKHIDEKTDLLQKRPEDPNLKDQIDVLRFIQNQIKIKRNEVIRQRLWVSACTALILVGMVLVYFPPTAIPGAFFIGSGLAFGAGSILTGLIRRLFLLLEKYGKMAWLWYQSRNQDTHEPDHHAANHQDQNQNTAEINSTAQVKSALAEARETTILSREEEVLAKRTFKDEHGTTFLQCDLVEPTAPAAGPTVPAAAPTPPKPFLFIVQKSPGDQKKSTVNNVHDFKPEPSSLRLSAEIK